MVITLSVWSRPFGTTRLKMFLNCRNCHEDRDVEAVDMTTVIVHNINASDQNCSSGNLEILITGRMLGGGVLVQ